LKTYHYNTYSSLENLWTLLLLLDPSGPDSFLKEWATAPSKILDKITLKRIYSVILDKEILQTPNFILEINIPLCQIHRVVDIIASFFEQKQFCISAFLDVTQAFDQV